MPSCAVFGCSNESRKSKGLPPSERIELYRFPSNKVIAKQWIKFCCRQDKVNLLNARICSIHFTAEDCSERHLLRVKLMGYSPKTTRKLREDAVPTLNGPKSSVSGSTSTIKTARAERACRRAKRQRAVSLLAECTEIANKNSSVAGLNFEVIDVDSIPEPNRLQGTAALREGEIPVNAEQQEVVEWEFEDGTSSSAVDPLSLDEDSTSPQDNPGRLGSNQSCQQKTQNLPSGENHITVEAVEISCVEKEHIVQEASNVATRKNIEGEVSLGSGLTSPSRRVPIRVKREK